MELPEHQFSYNIEASHAGRTIGQFLKEKGYSRQALIQLKQTEEGIRNNGRWAYTRDRLKEGDLLQIRLLEEVSAARTEPVCLPFAVVYEDEHLLVAGKPAGMPVHPSMNHHDNTLANAVAYHARERQEAYVYRCINRLDRDTTGLLILAKHMLSAAVLYGQMRRREIRRTYAAVVQGELKGPGRIDLPIGRKEGSAIERTVDRIHGERAVTYYEPLEAGDGWTLVQCRLETGRTHQIRVHMSHLGHPLLGDSLYGPAAGGAARQLLHSWKLSFVHPVTGEPMEFTQPLPEDMQQYFRGTGAAGERKESI